MGHLAALLPRASSQTVRVCSSAPCVVRKGIRCWQRQIESNQLDKSFPAKCDSCISIMLVRVTASAAAVLRVTRRVLEEPTRQLKDGDVLWQILFDIKKRFASRKTIVKRSEVKSLQSLSFLRISCSLCFQRRIRQRTRRQNVS